MVSIGSSLVIHVLIGHLSHFGINQFFLDNGLEDGYETRLYFPADCVSYHSTTVIWLSKSWLLSFSLKWMRKWRDLLSYAFLLFHTLSYLSLLFLMSKPIADIYVASSTESSTIKVSGSSSPLDPRSHGFWRKTGPDSSTLTTNSFPAKMKLFEKEPKAML